MIYFLRKYDIQLRCMKGKLRFQTLYIGGTMNKQQTLQSLSNVIKTYLRISQLKTILTVFFVGYTLTKIIKTMRSSN